MDADDVKGTVLPNDTVLECVQALGRVVKRAGRLAQLAKRRYERNKNPQTETNFLLAAQEYAYVAKLAADFRAAAEIAAAQQHAAKASIN